MRIWRVEPPAGAEDGTMEKGDRWGVEVVGEFGKGGARVGMVEVSVP